MVLNTGWCQLIEIDAFETWSEARQGIGHWIDRYNRQRPHSSLGNRTPDEACW
jgi:putative transposase